MASPVSFFGDIFALTKPRITLMAVFLACAGLLQANGLAYGVEAIMALFGIAALVSGSSALNMYLERDQDRLMLRTRYRPLPDERLNALWGMAIGAICSVAACLLLYATSNSLTLILGILSLVIYVFCYTPLKKRSCFALVVGSVPGAMPVVLGYTAFVNSIDLKVVSLFLWAFLWQIPHFLAISLFREQEYSDAGFPLFSTTFSEKVAKVLLLASSWMLVVSTYGLYRSGALGLIGLTLAMVLGVIFLVIGHRGAFSSPTIPWAKRVFRASIAYQGVLFLVLIAGSLL